MSNGELAAVTGAFSYTGKYIARQLLAAGYRVITLTRDPTQPNEFGSQVKAVSFNFDHPDLLSADLEGVSTLYNTFWIRFNHQGTTFNDAVNKTQTLVEAAKAAGVQRLVHVSVSNPSLDSPLPYFRGKAELEEIVRNSGLSYAIVRPTLIFGPQDILLNNIAYLLRRFPVFAIPGSGSYRLQPVSVEETAEICVRLGEANEDAIVDAAGPQILTFREMVQLIKRKIGSRSLLVKVSPNLALLLAGAVGWMVGDVMLNRTELEGLMMELLVSKEPPTAHSTLEMWLGDYAGKLGRRYSSELNRNWR